MSGRQRGVSSVKGQDSRMQSKSTPRRVVIGESTHDPPLPTSTARAGRRRAGRRRRGDTAPRANAFHRRARCLPSRRNAPSRPRSRRRARARARRAREVRRARASARADAGARPRATRDRWNARARGGERGRGGGRISSRAMGARTKGRARREGGEGTRDARGRVRGRDPKT